MATADFHLAVALDGAGWHPAAWREPDARPARPVHRRLLGRPGRRGRARPARLRHHRGRARPAVRRSLEPDDRTDQVRGRLDAVLDRRPGRAARPGTSGWCRPRSSPTPSRSTSSKAIATLDYVSTGRAGRAGAGLRPRRRGRALRPPHRPAARGRSTTPTPAALAELFDEAADYVEVRAPAVGQLGGRRGDPRRRHRPLRRPGQAALHRLRGPQFSRQGPLDHPAAAAGPAARHRARPPRRRRTGSSPARPTSASSPRATPADAARHRRRDPRRAGGRGPRRRDRARLRRPRGVPRRRPPPRRPPARPASTSWPAHEYAQRRARLHRHAGRARRPAARSGRRPASPGSGCGPAALPHDLPRSPAAWCPNCSAAAPSAPRTRPTPCAGCSACPAPPTATPPRPPEGDRA